MEPVVVRQILNLLHGDVSQLLREALDFPSRPFGDTTQKFGMRLPLGRTSRGIAEGWWSGEAIEDGAEVAAPAQRMTLREVITHC